VQDYSTNNVWTWDTSTLPADSYHVVVHVRNVGSTSRMEAETGGHYVLVPTGPATGATLTPDLASPQPVGTAQVDFTAGGSGGGGSYEYRFWLKSGGVWTVGQNYSTNNTWTWDTSTLPADSYHVAVHVRNVGSTAQMEADAGVHYVLAAPASGATLTPDLSSPQPIGTAQVVFTAGGSGGGGSYEYIFWLKSGGVWTRVQGYSTNNVWTWNTSSLLADSYHVVVHVRSVGSTARMEAETGVHYVIQ
jgi:hypothetical protein